MKPLALLLFAFFLLPSDFVFAGSATWNLNPMGLGGWEDPVNWTPETVPNGPDDVATFSVSRLPSVYSSVIPIEVNSIVFAPDGEAFTITLQSESLTISGTGIINNSDYTQNFGTRLRYNSFTPSAIVFRNGAAAGSHVSIRNGMTDSFSPPNETQFFDSSSADHAKITDEGTSKGFAPGGLTEFWNTATAASAIIVNQGPRGNGEGGMTTFHDTSTAGDATITNNPGSASFTSDHSETSFLDSSSAGNAVLVLEGATRLVAPGGMLTLHGSATLDRASVTCKGGLKGDGGGAQLYDTATAANSAITVQGSRAVDAGAGFVQFHDSSTAGDSILIAKDGEQTGIGGYIQFLDSSTGDGAQVKLIGSTPNLDISAHDVPGVTVGSLEGDGVVSLGANNLTTGNNSLSTSFEGLIEGDGSLTKTGTGQLTLTGASTYAGGTVVSDGKLVLSNASGSATGTGPVQVDVGTLGGSGIIGGPVTVGSGSGPGAFIAPGTGASTLTMQTTLTFRADGTYVWRVRPVGKADNLVANGVIIENGAVIQGLGRGGILATGTVLTAIDNISVDPISGTFANLPDGGTLIIGKNTFQASYGGGDGNDLTLTVVP